MQFDERYIVPALGVLLFILAWPLQNWFIGFLGVAAAGTYLLPPAIKVEMRIAIAAIGAIAVILMHQAFIFSVALLALVAIGATQASNRSLLKVPPHTFEYFKSRFQDKGWRDQFSNWMSNAKGRVSGLALAANTLWSGQVASNGSKIIKATTQETAHSGETTMSNPITPMRGRLVFFVPIFVIPWAATYIPNPLEVNPLVFVSLPETLETYISSTFLGGGLVL